MLVIGFITIFVIVFIFLYRQTINQQQAEKELHEYAIKYLEANPDLYMMVLCKIQEHGELDKVLNE